MDSSDNIDRFGPPHYFKSRFLIKVLRLCNLLEPTGNVISVTKTVTWSMAGMALWTIYQQPGDFVAVLNSLGGLGIAGGMYAHRRVENNKIKLAGK